MKPLLCLLLGLAALASASSAQEEDSTTPVNPAYVPRDFRLYDEGRYVYEQHCAVCHGVNGDGRSEFADSVDIKPRSFKLGLFKYRSTPWGKMPTNDDLLRTVRGGRTGTLMGMFTHLTDEQQRAVIEYIKYFSSKWRKPENFAAPIKLPEIPAWVDDDAKSASHVAAGKQVFQTTCAACHGPAGDGKGPAAAALRNDDGQPATPADLRLAHLRSGDDPIDMYRVLMTGLNGTPMVSFAEALTDTQKWEIVAYILTLRRDFKPPQK